MESRLQRILDRADIADLITAYTRAVDTCQFDKLREVFAEEAVLDYSSVDGPVASLDDVILFLEQGLALFDTSQHFIGQIEYTFVDDDTASVLSYLMNPMVLPAAGGNTTNFLLGGYYHWQFERRSDRWWATHMLNEIDWTMIVGPST